MFAPLPTKLEKLEAALQQIDVVTVRKPPPFLEIGKRLRIAYKNNRGSNYQLLSNSEWRQIPYAIWIKGEPALFETDPELLRKYWSEILPQALQSGSRRAKRWLLPLFFVYCSEFDAGNAAFRGFASKFRSIIKLAQGDFAAKLREMNERQEFFYPNFAPFNLARSFFSVRDVCLNKAMSDHLLWPGFEGLKMGEAILFAALKLKEENLRETTTVQKIMNWLSSMPAPIVKTDLRIAFADGMLLPWKKNRRFPGDLKKTLMDFFLQNYGDPKFVRHSSYQWGGVDPEAIKVMHYLLVGDTLRRFMKILERTADEIWSYRQKFWMSYYDAGYIEEAWMVLGTHAQIAARSNNATFGPQRFGRLETGASSNQSVLLLRIGDLVFSEWSHSGSLRAYHEGNSEAPAFYQSSYHGQTLRDAESLDFHNGLNMRPELRHTHSEYGTWQRKARDMIHRYTGIYLGDMDILL